MSSIDPGRTTHDPRTMPPPTTEVRGTAADTFRDERHVDRRTVRETKPSLITTEFWAMVAGVVALVVLYNVSDEGTLDLFRACMLATVLGAAYILSRGIAKSGSQKHWEDLEEPRRR